MGGGCSCLERETDDGNPQVEKQPRPQTPAEPPISSSISPQKKKVRKPSDGKTDPPKQYEALRVGLKEEKKIRKIASSVESIYRFPVNFRLNNSGKILVIAEKITTGHKCEVKIIGKRKEVKKLRNDINSEMELFATLDHPHIIKALEALESPSHMFVAYEALEGPTLQEFTVGAGCVSESFAAKIMLQLLKAVTFCHSKDIVHGDINPENVQFVLKKVTEGSQLKLKGFDGESMNPALRSKAIYTRLKSPFFAPELGNGAPTDRGDIWSCGVILLQILGFPLDETLEAHRVKKRTDLFTGGKWKGMSAEVNTFLVALLNLDPGQRPSAIEALESSWFPRESVKASSIARALSTVSVSKHNQFLRLAVVKFLIKHVVKAEQLFNLAEYFDMLDTNHDGYISPEELTAALKRIKPQGEAQSKAEEIMQSFDENASGKLDYTEFIISAYCPADLFSRKSLRIAFNAMDKDSSGKISLQELQAHLVAKSGEESEAAWRVFLSDIDRSGDGEIDFSEFEAILLKTVERKL